MKLIKTIAILFIWVLAFSGISLVNGIYRADKKAVESSKLLESMKYEEASQKINEAVDLNPYEPSYYRTRALIYLTNYVRAKDTRDLSGFKDKAYGDMTRSLDLNPDNLVTKRNLVPLYYFVAVKNVDISAGVENWDPEFRDATTVYFRDLKNMYAHDAGVITLVAEYERKLGLEDEYGKSREVVKGLRPDLLEWHESFN